MIEVHKNSYTVIGLQRSGNHAIIDWLYRNLEYKKVFFNNLRIGDTVDDRELFYFNDDKFINTNNKLRRYKEKFSKSDTAENENTRRVNELFGNGFKKDEGLHFDSSISNLVVSFEGVAINDDIEGIVRTVDNIGVGPSKYIVVILRDVHNFVASRIMHQLRAVNKKQSFSIEADIKKWEKYAQCMLLRTQLHDSHKTEYVFYNTWLNGVDSRDVYAKSLGLTSNTISNEVSVFGGGSSFQNVTSASTLNPTQRWKEIESIDNKLVVEQISIAKKYFVDNQQIEEINSDLLKLQY